MDLGPFCKMTGREMVELGKEKFLAITPAFTGDILWEHLDILQKGKQHVTGIAQQQQQQLQQEKR